MTATIKRLLIGVTGVIAVWLLLITVIVKPLVNTFLDNMVSDLTGRSFTTGAVLLNPIGWSVTVEALELLSPEGTVQLGAQRVVFDLGFWESVLSGGVALDRIDIAHVHGHLYRDASGALNIDDIVEKFFSEDTTAAEETDTAALKLLVKELKITLDDFTFRDSSRSQVFSNSIQGLTLEGSGIGTDHGPGTLALDFTVASGGHFSWSGDLNLGSQTTHGQGSIADFELAPFWAYLSGNTRATLAKGNYHGDAAIALNWDTELSGNVELNDHALRDLRFDPVDGNSDTTGLALDELAIKSLNVDLAQQSVALGPVRVLGLDLRTAFDEGAVSLVDLFVDGEEETGQQATSATTDTKADVGDPFPADKVEAKPWQVSSDGLDVSESSVHITTSLLKPGQLRLTDIAVAVGPITWPQSIATESSVAFAINEASRASVKAAGNLIEGDIEAVIEIETLPLSWFEPMAEDILNTELTGGETSATLTTQLAKYQPQTVQGQVEIDNFRGHLPDSDAAIGGFRQLRFEDINVVIPEKRLHIDQVHLTGARSALRINQDGTINATQLIKQSAVEEAITAGPAENADLSASEERAGDADLPVEEDPWQVSIPNIFVHESALAFTDDSLAVQFTAEIEDLFGELRGFNTDPDTHMTVDLEGDIDGFAPVTIAGQLGHFSEPVDGDVVLSMRGIDLARLTPYAASYAGYPIERGVMTVELDYKLENGLIAGNNHVIVERLKLGKKTDSPDAPDLPIKTAIALLSNVAGVIDVSLDVSGDPANPDFDIFSAVAQAASNLMVNIVAAPFKLLASLVGEEDIPETVRFGAGSAQLTDPSRKALDALVAGLLQRPKLMLVINPQVNRTLDSERLARQALKLQLVGEGITAEDIEERSSRWAAAIDTLAARAGLDESLSPIDKYTALTAAIEVSDLELQQLASDRAAAVKSHIVTIDGFDPQRAVISQWDKASPDLTGVTLEIDVL